ncbi:triosephosphate isomerase [Candidatus Daviesbacteria bacterium]|nr:triosephosphate isomerase [Candidatus Daviesbacteria bacterium]
MKDIWIIANWKSNKNISEALDWISQVGPKIPKQDNLKVVVCPTFSALSEVKKAITVGNFPLLVGAQDLSPFGIGAYTGEEPAELLNQLITLTILGHSERRQNFRESDETIAKKTQQALGNNITPLVCVQNEEIPVPEGCKLVAYEPIWAIGTGNPDTPENANVVAEKIKQQYSASIEVVYGGSVHSGNVKDLVMQENINGVLVGSASLDAEEFIKICQVVSE